MAPGNNPNPVESGTPPDPQRPSLGELHARVGDMVAGWIATKRNRQLAVSAFTRAVVDILPRVAEGSSRFEPSPAWRLVSRFDLAEAVAWCRRQAYIDGFPNSRWDLTTEDRDALELAHWYFTTSENGVRPAIDPSALLRFGSHHELTAQAVGAQRRGALRAVTSRELVEGLLCGSEARTAARTVLAEDQYRALDPRTRELVSDILYRTYLFIDAFLITRDGELDDPLIHHWALCRAVSVACAAEVATRLNQSSIGRNLWAVISRDDSAALNALLRPILYLVRSCDLNGSRGLLHQGGTEDEGYGPAIDDEKRSVLQLHLCSRIDDIISKGAADVLPHVAFTGLDEWARRFAALCLLIDGKFDNLPVEVKCDFLDYIDAQTAQKRGGTEPDDWIDDLGSGARRFLLAPCDSEPDAGLDWKDVTLWLEEAARAVPHATVALPLLQLQITTADEDLLQREVAARLGCTPHTVRNHVTRLEPLRQMLRDRAYGRPSPSWTARIGRRRGNTESSHDDSDDNG